MNNYKFPPNAINYQELNAFLSTAKKETLAIETFENNDINEKHEFNNAINDWQKASQKILLMLKKKDQVSAKNKNPKFLIALGAMGAHINMALQALKTIELD